MAASRTLSELVVGRLVVREWLRDTVPERVDALLALHEASRKAGSLDGEHESRGAERRAGDGPRCGGQGGGARAQSGGGRLGYGASGCHILGHRPPQVFLSSL
jgi:hypothetical protein